MPYPIIMLSGRAGSGKSTIAQLAANYYKERFGQSVAIVALADPIKRLAQKGFRFTDDQLWGPSANRESIAPGYWDKNELNKAFGRLFNHSETPIKGGVKSGEELRIINNRLHSLKDKIHDRPPTAREALQFLGTEWGRLLNPNIWIDHAVSTANILLSGGYTYSPQVGLIASDTPGYDYVILPDGRFRNEILAIKSLGGAVWRVDLDQENISDHISESGQATIPRHFFDHTIHNKIYPNSPQDSVVYLRNKIEQIISVHEHWP